MNDSTTIPECWEEMDPRHFRRLLKLVYVMMFNPTVTMKDVLRSLGDYICGCPKFNSQDKITEYCLMLDAISDKLAWIFREEDGQVLFDYCTTENKIPVIGNLKGPLSHGSDLSFGEYRSACEFYNRYTLEHEPELLDILCGILYRKPNKQIKKESFSGNYREPFNKHHIETYGRRMRNAPGHLKWGIYNWFGYFCKYLISGVFVIEGKEVSFEPIFGRDTDPDARKDESLGMMSVLFSLAETGTFGNVKETDNELLFNVLLKLLADKQQADKLKKKK